MIHRFEGGFDGLVAVVRRAAAREDDGVSFGTGIDGAEHGFGGEPDAGVEGGGGQVRGQARRLLARRAVGGVGLPVEGGFVGEGCGRRSIDHLQRLGIEARGRWRRPVQRERHGPSAEDAAKGGDVVFGIVEAVDVGDGEPVAAEALLQAEAGGVVPRHVTRVAQHHCIRPAQAGHDVGGQRLPEEQRVEIGGAVKAARAGGGGADVVVGIAGARPRVRPGVAAARLEVGRAGIGGIDAGALVVLVPAFDVDVAGGRGGVHAGPGGVIIPAAVACQEKAGVADVLVPVAGLDHGVDVTAGIDRGEVGVDREELHEFIGEAGHDAVGGAEEAEAVGDGGVRGTEGGVEPALQVRTRERGDIATAPLEVPGAQQHTAIQSREVIGRMRIRVDGEVLLEEADVVARKLILAGGGGQVRAGLGPPDRFGVKEGAHLWHLVALGAQLGQGLEEVHALGLQDIHAVNVQHIEVGGHHLLDLALPPGDLAGPVRAALERAPGAVLQAVGGGVPVKDKRADIGIGCRQPGGSGVERREPCRLYRGGCG